MDGASGSTLWTLHLPVWVPSGPRKVSKTLTTSWPAYSLALQQQDPVPLYWELLVKTMVFPALQAAGGLRSPQLLRGSPALTSVVVTTVLSVFLGTGHRRGCWVQKAKEIFGPAASPVPTPTRSIRQRRWRGEDRYFLTPTSVIRAGCQIVNE